MHRSATLFVLLTLVPFSALSADVVDAPVVYALCRKVEVTGGITIASVSRVPIYLDKDAAQAGKFPSGDDWGVCSVHDKNDGRKNCNGVEYA